MKLCYEEYSSDKKRRFHIYQCDNYYLVKIEQYHDEYDYYSLLECGAPHDEFDSYSREFAEIIQEDNAIEEIANMIANRMDKAFGNGVSIMVQLSRQKSKTFIMN